MNKFSHIHAMVRSIINDVYELTLAEVRERFQRGERFKELDEIMDIIDKYWNAVWERKDSKIIEKLIPGNLSEKEITAYENTRTVDIPQLFLSYFTRDKATIIPTGSTATSDGLPICNGYHWQLLHKLLLSKYADATVDSIDRQSSEVLRHILLPEDNKEFRKTGLVVGQVQSGKTANYTALIAKATDCGYKIIIVLSGVHNDLRNQTQERLDEEYVGFHRYCLINNTEKASSLNKKSSRKCQKDQDGHVVAQKKVDCGIGLFGEFIDNKVNVGTYTDDDFRGHPGANTPILFVVKKNNDVFTSLKNFISGETIRNLPTLVIDDEADQASVNTSTKQKKASTINGDIRALLKYFPRVSFIGYTATPFANVFIDSQATDEQLGDDLFPKDFIVRLNSSPEYFGPLQFFGDNHEEHGLELFMDVSDETNRILSGTKGKGNKKSNTYRLEELPEECKTAFYQFVISAAIRQWRDKKKRPDDWEDNGNYEKPVLTQSMLVHISFKIYEQGVIAEHFKCFVDSVREVLLQDNEFQKKKILELLEGLFENQKIVTEKTKSYKNCAHLSTDWSLPSTFEEVMEEVIPVLEDMTILCINGQSNDDPVLEPCDESLERPHGKNIIYIGGNKLSRGLTLPGLCVSFFLRSTTMYDTLLQMGRWFGYRNGYVDLCRISTTPKIIDRFRAITEACLDFDNQIDSMSAQNRTPNNYRLRVLSHPGLLVTAKNKMRNVKNARIGFNNDKYEQRYLGLTADNIQHNLAVADNFYKAVNAKGRLVYASKDYGLGEFPQASYAQGVSKHPSGRLWSGVPADVICDFLTSYQEDTGGRNAHISGIAKHIKRVQEKNELTSWSVFIPGEASLKSNRFDVAFTHRKIARSSVSVLTGNIDSVVLPVLKGGGHEYVGVPKDVMEAAEQIKKDLESKDQYVNGDLFKAVREQAGKIAPSQGYLILYLLRSDELDGRCSGLQTVSERKQGEQIPLVSFYLWTPDSANQTYVNMSVFNQTVTDSDDDEDEQDQD